MGRKNGNRRRGAAAGQEDGLWAGIRRWFRTKLTQLGRMIHTVLHEDKKRRPRRLGSGMQTKLAVLFGLVLLAFAVLAVRLAMIAVNNNEEYKKIVLSQLEYDSTELPFKRGSITDRNGTILASSELVYTVVIDCYVANNGPDNDEGVSSYLEPTLAAAERLGLDRDAIEEHIRDYPDDRYYVVLTGLSYEEKKAYDQEIEDANDRVTALTQEIEDEESGDADETRLENLNAQLDAAQETADLYNNSEGLWFEEHYVRSYPNGTLLAHVLGYATSDNEGVFGLEEYYNDTLNGTAGREYGYLNSGSTLERTVIEAEDGNNLVLTIDANIQSIVEKYLQEFMDEYADGYYHEGYGANSASCIIMEVNTGEILAMASYPTYDPNDPYDTDLLVGLPMLDESYVPTYEYLTEEYVEELYETAYMTIDEDELAAEGYTEAEIEALEEEQEAASNELSSYFYYLWSDYCISSYYEPGSVIKPFTVAAALESGALTGDETFYCGGYLTVGGWDIYCHNTDGDGTLTIVQAVERSCNVALMQIALATGVETFTRFQRIFNFGLKTNIDLAKEVRTDSAIYTAETMEEVDLATNSFGQSFDVTMIQVITAFCSLVNGGYYYEPHVVSAITSASGATVETIEPRLLKRTISEETSAQIREALVQVVAGDNGTGKTARPAGYMIGGKTGTAETVLRDDTNYVVSFIGYAPADDPQIAIYVVVDRPNVYPQDDAKYATRIVRKILTEVLPYLGIYMTEELTEDEEAELIELNLENTLAYGASNFDQIPVEIAMNMDTDGDGVYDAVDGDGDGVADTALDSDGDGVTDAVDTNGDGICDLYDTDNDGVVDSSTPIEGQVDITQNTDTGASETYKTYEIDEETGYYIDPDTGNLIDPDTGYVYSSSTLPDDLGTGAASSDAGAAADSDGNITGETEEAIVSIVEDYLSSAEEEEDADVSASDAAVESTDSAQTQETGSAEETTESTDSAQTQETESTDGTTESADAAQTETAW